MAKGMLNSTNSQVTESGAVLFKGSPELRAIAALEKKVDNLTHIQLELVGVITNLAEAIIKQKRGENDGRKVENQ